MPRKPTKRKAAADYLRFERNRFGKTRKLALLTLSNAKRLHENAIIQAQLWMQKYMRERSPHFPSQQSGGYIEVRPTETTLNREREAASKYLQVQRFRNAARMAARKMGGPRKRRRKKA